MEKPDSRKPVHEGIKDYKYNLILQTKWYEIAKLTKPNIVQQYYIHTLYQYVLVKNRCNTSQQPFL